MKTPVFWDVSPEFKVVWWKLDDAEVTYVLHISRFIFTGWLPRY